MTREELATMALQLRDVGCLLEDNGQSVRYNEQDCVIFRQSIKDVGAGLKKYAEHLNRLAVNGFTSLDT